MTGQEFDDVAAALTISRAELIRRLGLAKNTGNAYALGRSQIPTSVRLACAALLHGLKPAGSN